MAQPGRRKIRKVNLPPLNKENKYNTNLSEKIQHLISYYSEDMLELENNIDALNQAIYDGDTENIRVFKLNIQDDLDGIYYHLDRYRQAIINNL